VVLAAVVGRSADVSLRPLAAVGLSRQPL